MCFTCLTGLHPTGPHLEASTYRLVLIHGSEEFPTRLHD